MTKLGKISDKQVSVVTQADTKSNPATDLSFMRLRQPAGSGIDYWTVQGTGDYVQDLATGKALAEEYLDYLGRYPTNGNRCLLGDIVIEMLRKPDIGKGVIVGFMSGVNARAMGAAAVLHVYGGQQ